MTNSVMCFKTESHFHKMPENAAELSHIYHGADHLIFSRLVKTEYVIQARQSKTLSA